MIVDLTNAADWVPIAELREFCAASADQDTIITPLQQAGMRFVEEYTAKRFGVRDVEIRLPTFGYGPLALGICPLTAITSVDYVDTDEAPQTLAGFNESLETGVLWQAADWPSVSTVHPIPISIKATGGVAVVPADVQLAIKLFVLSHWDDLDQDAAIKALLAPHVWR